MYAFVITFYNNNDNKDLIQNIRFRINNVQLHHLKDSST